MRPLTLTIDGLRSYRHPATLDFADVTLLAVVGDTGAGKSSILEAITYALYSAATWTGQPGELIADGARTMKVALTFDSNGKRWQVTRSMSRDGYPAPVHRLVCEQDGVALNGRSEVNAAIEGLVGLDCKAFLQSVILPQGRFAELLRATPAERGKILQNIFRVDEVIAARDTADRLLSRWEPRRDALVATRSLYLGDPAGAAEEANRRRSEAETRQQALQGIGKTVGDLQASAAEADSTAAELDALVASLTDPVLTGAAGELSAIGTLAAQLATSRDALESSREGARQREKGALEQLDRAVREGVGLTHLVKAETELEAIARELGDIAEATNQAAIDTTELEEARQHALQQRTAAEAAAQTATASQNKAAGATQSAAEAVGARDAAREALAAYRNRAEQEESVADELRQCCEDLEVARADAERFAATALAESTKADAAEQRLREVERTANAAAASHDCNPGDPCPVCDRELPKSWRRPTAPKLENARRQRDQADRVKDKARTEADTAAGLHSAGVARESERRAALARAERATSRALTRVSETCLLTATQLKAKLGADEAVLAKVEAAAAKAEEQRDKAVANAGDDRDIATRLSAEAKAAAKSTSDRERSLRSSRDKLAKSCAGLRSRAAKLPDSFRPDIVREAALDLTVGAPQRSDALGTSRVIDSLGAVRTSLASLREVEAAAAEARGEREHVEEQLDTLQARWTSEVANPTSTAARRADQLANRLADILTRLEQPAGPRRPSHDDAAELAHWSAAVQKASDTTARALAKNAKTQRDQASRARKQATESLAKFGISDLNALEAAVVDAATAAQIAAKEEANARAQIPLVAELTDRIKRGSAFLADLRAVHDLLGNSRYIGFLMHRRQEALLGVATNLLGDMSAGRFGFSENFQVVDCYSGQPRSTSTLSGGESFLASMALALAMVELAGRAGGRLDSLFLDEGFGSLDAKALDIAIDTLEGRAKAGRLVAVISHVKTVAERIEDVLAVTYSAANGSSFRMLTPAERTGLVRDDATDAVAGLLS